MTEQTMFPLGASHAPFWRANAWDPAEWKDDLIKMKQLGMTCISVFACWHKIEREEGKYDFSELDLIFKLAEEVGMKITMGLGVHISYSIYPPRWIIRKYKHEGMMDEHGHTDADGSYRQPCFEEEEYRNYAERYFRALVRHFRNHPALLQWRVWGEATLECYCYCPVHQAMFRNYLKEKYGTIQELNRFWGSEGPADFISFEEIFPPRKQYRFHSYHELLDWQDFMDKSLTAAVRRVNDWIKQEDQKTMTLGEFWLPEGNSSGGGDDVWKLASTSDTLGLSIFNKPPASCAKDMDLMCSAARLNHREAWVIEIQGGTRIFSAGWDEPYSPTGQQATLWMWQFVAHGAKGIFYWTWRPRTSDLEGGEFGLARRDGSLPQRTLDMQQEFQLLQKLAPVLLPIHRKAEVAILMSREAEHLAPWDRIDRPDKSYYSTSLFSAHEILWRQGIPADYIGGEDWDADYLKQYKVLLLPFAFCINRSIVPKLRKYVEDGGILIADFMLGAKDQRGYCDNVLPGFGLGDIFGIAEDEILNGTGQALKLEAGGDIHVHNYVQTCRLRGATPLATFDGKPACAVNQLGKGKAYFIGTVFFHRDGWKEQPGNANFLYQLLDDLGVKPPVVLSSKQEFLPKQTPETVLQDSPDGSKILFVLNHAEQPLQATVHVKLQAKAVTDLRTDQPVTFQQEANQTVFTLRAEPKQCQIFKIQNP